MKDDRPQNQTNNDLSLYAMLSKRRSTAKFSKEKSIFSALVGICTIPVLLVTTIGNAPGKASPNCLIVLNRRTYMRMRFSIQATALMPVFDPEVTLLFIQDSQANKYSIPVVK